VYSTVQYSSTVRTVQSPARNPQMRKNEAGRARDHTPGDAQQRPRKRSTVRHPGAGRIGKEGEKGPALWENRTVSGHYISFCDYFIKLPLFYVKMRDNFRRLRARGNASRAIVNGVALRGFRGNGVTVQCRVQCSASTVRYGVQVTVRTVLYSIIVPYCTVLLYVPYSTVQYSTVQYGTVARRSSCTVQYNTESTEYSLSV